MSTTTWAYLESGQCAPAWNMALDETLLESMPCQQRPVLRLYGWTEPAATFGYFQKYAEVERLTGLRPLIRRPTGGGLVPHDADWTYSLAFPTDHEWYSVAAIESYRRAHAWLQAAFRELGIQTQLAPTPLKTLPGQCFVGYEQYDLLWRGAKIAGAAQRRRRDGLLIQGSVQPPKALSVTRADWQQAMLRCAPFGPEPTPVPLVLAPEWLRRAGKLANEKYGRDLYNRRR
jgi:lipoyl(octanoyl) transferase